MTHISVDTETWGTTPGSAIRSIGAVAFDPITGEIGDSFYRNILDSSCEECGLTRDPQTVAWWADQSLEAQEALLDDQQHLAIALQDFRAWWATVQGEEVWSYGANADIPWLEAAFAASGMQVQPWSYKKTRCARTILALAGVDIPRSQGVHHNALDDARNQALAIHQAYERLALNVVGDPRAAAINLLVADSHGASANAGWWMHGDINLKNVIADPNARLGKALVAEKLCLIHSEISEAMEGFRKSLMDDKLPHRPMIEVELVDGVIRICDLAGALGLDLGGAYVEKRGFNEVRPDHKLEARAAAGGKAF